QCEYGRQSSDLSDYGAAACGQFLEDPTNDQRGLHGTAAALRVVASSSHSTAQQLTRRLVAYLAEREKYEAAITTPASREHRMTAVTRDNLNVIKQSELLFALSFVSSFVPGSASVVTKTIRTLQDSTVDGRGWGYWTDEVSGGPQPLPTAYAVRALAAHRTD